MNEYITDYVERIGEYSFDEQPFNEVDALVLAQFAYFKWENVIPTLIDNAESLTLLQMRDKMIDAEVFVDERWAADNIRIWNAMVSSKRYSDMKCNYFAEETNVSLETQFCAFTAFPNATDPIVCFRGTDETIVGWKEDFNMAFAKPVPGQRMAALYLKQIALRISGDFMVCGHSKGGNLGVYAAVTAEDALRERIQAVYSFDGPGFRAEILSESNYALMEKKIHKFIPQSSIVGMLLENHENYTVVKSTTVGGALQHNPYTWVVCGNEFAKRGGVMPSTKYMNVYLNQWVSALSQDQLRVFVDTLFDVINASGAETVTEMSEDMVHSVRKMLKAAKNIDDETLNILKLIFKEFLSNLKKLE